MRQSPKAPKPIHPKDRIAERDCRDLLRKVIYFAWDNDKRYDIAIAAGRAGRWRYAKRILLQLIRSKKKALRAMSAKLHRIEWHTEKKRHFDATIDAQLLEQELLRHGVPVQRHTRHGETILKTPLGIVRVAKQGVPVEYVNGIPQRNNPEELLVSYDWYNNVKLRQIVRYILSRI